MKIMGIKDVESVIDVRCDTCGASTLQESNQPQYGALTASWGYGSRHDGEHYEVQLCETCFFSLLAEAKALRRANMLFSENNEPFANDLGLVNSKK